MEKKINWKTAILYIIASLSLVISIITSIVTAVFINGKDDPVLPPLPPTEETNLYVGYDNYVWNGTQRTDAYIAPQAQEDEVFEDTLGVTGEMSSFFDGEYVDLAQNHIALMSYYKENANVALYSGLEITDLTFYAKTSGKLSVGTSKVSDVVNSRKTGEPLTVDNAQNYFVVKGKTTIHFKEPLELNEDETIVLGGNNSVSLYCLKDVPVDDEVGNFTLLDNKAHDEVIASGEYADTLAIQVKVNIVEWERPVFKTMAEIREKQPNKEDISKNYLSWGVGKPIAYKDLRLFAGKRITRIDVPVMTITLPDKKNEKADGVFTVSVFKNTKEGLGSRAIEKHELKLNWYVDENGGGWVDKWITFECNIQLAEDETLGFGGPSDSVIFGWDGKKDDEPLRIVSPFSWQFCGEGENWGGVGDGSIYMDVYYTEFRNFETQVEHLESLEGELVQKQKETELKAKLGGKQFSILGDSVSAYNGYSNNTKYNSTIENNAYTYWDGYELNRVWKTWWYKALETTGMELCVNNSYSADKVSELAQTRCLQLHDDTHDEQQTKDVYPDIIAVYMGANDYNWSISVSDFEKAYSDMLSQLRHKYDGADVYLFTLLPNFAEHSRPESDLIAYNEAITRLARQYMCHVVDLYNDSGINSTNLPFYFVSSEDAMIHPNEWGMDKIAQCFFDAVYRTYCEQ